MSGSSSEQEWDWPTIQLMLSKQQKAEDEGYPMGHTWAAIRFLVAKVEIAEFMKGVSDDSIARVVAERDRLAQALQQQEEAYAALEAQLMAVSDAHAALVDKLSNLAAEAIR